MASQEYAYNITAYKGLLLINPVILRNTRFAIFDFFFY